MRYSRPSGLPPIHSTPDLASRASKRASLVPDEHENPFLPLGANGPVDASPPNRGQYAPPKNATGGKHPTTCNCGAICLMAGLRLAHSRCRSALDAPHVFSLRGTPGVRGAFYCVFFAASSVCTAVACTCPASDQTTCPTDRDET